MRLPVLQGVIRRRILVNFRADPEVVARQLPRGFRPKLHDARAVAGICLIRLEHIRPAGLPRFVGASSENAAHRVAVLWEDKEGVTREGVFIARRDTGSGLTHLLGGRVFPGEHHRASFAVEEAGGRIALSMQSADGAVSVEVAGRVADALPASSIFPSLAAASSFFEAGSLGYSVTREGSRLDGLTLKVKDWRVEPLGLDTAYSSYLSDESRFPRGSVEFDHALLMRDIAHEWHGADDLYV